MASGQTQLQQLDKNQQHTCTAEAEERVLTTESRHTLRTLTYMQLTLIFQLPSSKKSSIMAHATHEKDHIHRFGLPEVLLTDWRAVIVIIINIIITRPPRAGPQPAKLCGECSGTRLPLPQLLAWDAGSPGPAPVVLP